MLRNVHQELLSANVSPMAPKSQDVQYPTVELKIRKSSHFRKWRQKMFIWQKS